MHEAEMNDNNCMVTLTYDDENPKFDGDLHPEHVQLWMKRLRQEFKDRKIKFFLAGEYGDKTQRPHYHVLLFGLDFQSNIDYNHSDPRPSVDILQETWTFGHVHVAPLTYETAAYVARYCLKKQEKEIDYVDKSTGAILHREFTRMSRRPGVAARWLEKNHADTYKDDTVIMQGNRKSRPPRYYDKLIEKMQGAKALEKIKSNRLEASVDRRANNTPDRLRVRELVAKARNSIRKRSYENG